MCVFLSNPFREEAPGHQQISSERIKSQQTFLMNLGDSGSISDARYSQQIKTSSEVVGRIRVREGTEENAKGGGGWLLFNRAIPST